MPPTTRRPIYSNPLARSWTSPSPDHNSASILNFHRTLPSYAPTPLHSLPTIAQQIGVKQVLLKDETTRLSLPSFKILGASWGIHRAVAKKAGLPLSSSLKDLSAAAKEMSVSLLAATDGNHGRAVARMGALLVVKDTRIFIPTSVDPSTRNFIAQEGAEVIAVNGDYDAAVKEAASAAKSGGGILIQDMAFEDYKEVPKWIVDGYSTLLVEIDEQLPEHADVVVAPVGVGSLAQAVVSHCKTEGRSTVVLAVEPDTAGCLYKSLTVGKSTPVKTSPTIQTGMNCGTVSDSAWPILKAGVDVSTTISDFEVHEAVQYLQSVGIQAGPCGAAPLAALKHVAHTDLNLLGLNEHSVVVLICTEGSREYSIPESVSEDDSVALLQNLESSTTNGEKATADYISAWLEHRDIKFEDIQQGKRLFLNGQVDTVTNSGYDGDLQNGNASVKEEAFSTVREKIAARLLRKD